MELTYEISVHWAGEWSVCASGLPFARAVEVGAKLRGTGRELGIRRSDGAIPSEREVEAICVRHDQRKCKQGHSATRLTPR